MSERAPFVDPVFGAKAFNCPLCRTFAKQHWAAVMANIGAGSGMNYVEGHNLTFCQACGQPAVWLKDKMIHPDNLPVEAPNPDLGKEIQSDYREAASIVGRSPRGAVALLRLCVQKLCQQLGEKGDNINEDIGSLVKKGLSPKIQKALDSMRVIGNNAVHPGQIDIQDKPEVAIRLFKFLNLIAQTMITDPKEIDTEFASLPPSALDGIKKRDTPPPPAPT